MLFFTLWSNPFLGFFTSLVTRKKLIRVIMTTLCYVQGMSCWSCMADTICHVTNRQSEPLKLAKRLIFLHQFCITFHTNSFFKPTMRIALLLSFIASAKASGDYFEPFPTCADCLPTSVYEAPGIGFSLSLSSGYTVPVKS